MSPGRIATTLSTVVLVLAWAAPVESQSLRDRIYASRAKAAARAQAEMRAKGLDELSRRRANYDPEKDPEMWRIDKFHIPSPKMMGFSMGTGTEPRFYAGTTREALPSNLTVDSNVFFYEMEKGQLRLAGRGQVKKIRSKKDNRMIEASILSFKYAKPMTKRVRALFISVQSQEKVLQLVDGRTPKSEDWYMSSTLKGPDTDGWTMQQLENFAFGNPWQGMTDSTLIAILGPPHQSMELGDKASYIWGAGETARRFTVQDGKVMDMAVGQY